MKNYLKIVSVDEYSITPKYLQLVNGILRGIENGQIGKGDVLPSINAFCIALETSRNTIERAYTELKKLGVLKSVAGKGYFISHVEINQPVKIMLLFNKLSSHKKIMYDAFATTLGSAAAIDFYIYNNDFNFFKKLIFEKIDNYSKIVIIPHFLDDQERAYEVINNIPKNKLVLMDKLESGVTGSFGAVYENFENDLYHALEQLLEKLGKYHTLKIIFPENSYYPRQIIAGFVTFCDEYAFDYAILNTVTQEPLKPGTVYINIVEDHLVELIQNIITAGLIVGKDVGVISYNETPLKKIILRGITTISTDFELMGKKTAELVLSNSTDQVAIPFMVTYRDSL